MAGTPASKMSIQWKLPLMVGGLLLAVTGGLAWAAYLQVVRSSEQVASERLNVVVTQMDSMLRTQADQLERRTHALTATPAIHQYLGATNEPDRLKALDAMKSILPSDSASVAMELLDVSGRSVLTRGFIEHRGSRLGSEDLPTLPEGDDSAGVGRFQAMGDTVVYPIVGTIAENGNLLGYLVLWRKVSTSARAREQVQTLVGSDAVLYVGSNHGAWTDQVGVAKPPPVDVSHLTGVTHYVREGSGAQVAAAKAIPDTPWLVLLEFPQDVVMAPARQFLGRLALIAFVVLAFGLVATWYFSRGITAPLRSLTAAADAIGAGDHTIRVPVHGTDELGRLAAAFNQMVDRVDAEAAAREASEAQWRLLFENTPHAMLVYDVETLKFLTINDAAVRDYGYSREEFSRLTLKSLRPVPDGPLALETDPRAARGEDVDLDARHRRKDGKILDIDLRSHAIEFAGHRARMLLAEDVSARKALEAQLRQAQKMEAIGRLAGGVAHDFNNLLAVITTYTELLQGEMAPDDKRIHDLEEVIRAAHQAHGLTRQLLAFSRQQVLQPVVLDPNTTVASVERMLRRLIGEDIALETRLDPVVGRVMVDPGQLEQVILNLAVNARDAMPSGGSLTITTANVDIDEASENLYGIAASGRFVSLSVADTGVGMSPETRAQIFEPFFTTKGPGKGTGLGLATVYGIVTQSGGHVTVYSEPGLGSTFRVYLPLAAEAVAVPAATARPQPPVRGTETILLVEDDAAVRAAAGEVLGRLGYTVIPAANGEEALALAARYRDPLHLVVSDVVMPKIDGPTLVSRLRELRPGLHALLMSGYAGDAIANRGVIESGIHFLEKPFSVAGLAKKVREAMASESRA